jgi:glycosyltransferase involved in cell wall biosynthesis
LPKGEAVVLMAARLLSTKGVREYVAAAQQLRAAGIPARFWLAGELDPANPASIQSLELDTWIKQGDVQLLGHRLDIPALMAQAHMVVLPSYREGLPKVLIEAAACGRSVVTTDVPGCRDAIEVEVTGVLVPSKDSVLLADAIKRLVMDRALCDAMGRAGRRRAEQVFDVNTVVNTHLDIYRALGNYNRR